MRIVIAAVAAIATLAFTAPASAQSVFDGTWKVDTGSAEFGGKPISRSLKAGTYRCISCSIPWSVPADGEFHPVTGNPYVDHAAVKVVDPATVQFRYRKDGKIVDTTTLKAAADGMTLAFDGRDTGGANGKPVTYSGTQARIGAAPAGEHAIAGEWREQKGAAISDAGISITMATKGDTLTMSYPTGESVTATFGGPAAMVANDPGKTMVQLVRTGPNSFTSTDTRDGKTISVATVTVLPDGRTLNYTSENKRNGSTQKITAIKQ